MLSSYKLYRHKPDPANMKGIKMLYKKLHDNMHLVINTITE